MEVVIVILINNSASIKFRIVEMDNWLNLNKLSCWDLIRDPFASEANPWNGMALTQNTRTDKIYFILKGVLPDVQ